MANRIGARFFRELAVAYGEMAEGSFVPYEPYKRLERRYVLAERLVREGRLDEAVAVLPEVARRTRPDEQDDFWSCEACWGETTEDARFCPNCGAVLLGDVGVNEALESPVPGPADWVIKTAAELGPSY